MGLAYSVVQRTGVPNGVSIQDTEEFSDACLGLINAERKYDPTKAKFSTFAYTVCYREVIRGKQKRYKKRQLGFGCVDEDLTEKLIDIYQYYTCANINKLRSAGYNKQFTSLKKGVEICKNY